MPSRQEVAQFLSSFKVAMDFWGIAFKYREKNLQSIADLGITMDDVKTVIAGLSPDNYKAGPKLDDTDPNKEVWEFGTDVGGTEVYIKLRLSPDTRKKVTLHPSATNCMGSGGRWPDFGELSRAVAV